MLEIKKRGIVIVILTIALAIVLTIQLSKFIFNSAPVVEKISFIPETLHTDYNLKGEISFYDEEDPLLQTRFIWYKNNEKIFEETKTDQEKTSFSILNSNNFSKKDIIKLEAYTTDNKKESEHKTLEITVKNSPPKQPLLIRPQDNKKTEDNNILFEFNSIDKDKDPLTYSLYINDILKNTTQSESIKLNLEDGTYEWKITTTDQEEEAKSITHTLKIGKKTIKKKKTGPNTPPKLIKNIENQSWDIFGFNLNAFNLNDYFQDPDNDSLTFDTEGNTNISIIISSNGKVSFLHPKEWHGTGRIIFTANDQITTIKSNQIQLKVGNIKIKESKNCPGPCCNIDCGQITKDCPDNTQVSCDMYCVRGECVPCYPLCGEIYEPPKINMPLFAANNIIDGMPCIDVGDKEKEEVVQIKDPKLLEKQIPQGYSIISGPVSLDCEGGAGLTLNIPPGYEDVKALKCQTEGCFPTVLQRTTELDCGGNIVKRTLRSEPYLKPEFMPINITEKNIDLKEKTTIFHDRLKIEFSGDTEDAKVQLSMPSEPVQEALNPSLKIVNTPILLKIEGQSSPNTKISSPYVASERIDQDSISFYVQDQDRWKRLGGEVFKENKLAEITIENLRQYKNDKNEVMIVLMGLIMQDRFKSSFVKEYEPIQKSKDMIVMIHGLGSTPATFKELIDDITLTNQPYHIYTLGHSSYTPIRKTADELKDYLELNSKQYDNIYIIAHSMGGLVTQKALYDSYNENQQDNTKYTFIKKVRKTILAGVPNEGSPIAQIYYELFDYLINKESPYTLFDLNVAIIDDLTKGSIISRVPTINYYVIAGTKTFPFIENLLEITGDLFGGIKNDGVVSVRSAQHIGKSYINKFCENYWEFNMSHGELIDKEDARKLITGLITEDKYKDNAAIISNTKYFELQLNNCNKEDSFLIIGKKLKQQTLPLHKTTCGFCGDSYCSTRENIFNCPADCVKITKNKYIDYPLVFIVLGIFGFLIFFIFKKELHKKAIKTIIKPKKEKHKEEHYDINEIKIEILEKRIKELKKHYSEDQIIRILTAHGFNRQLVETVIHEQKYEREFNYFGFKD